MTLRRRAFLLVALAIFVVLLSTLAMVDLLVTRTLKQQLDGALLTHARTEAASAFDHPGGEPDLHDRPVQGGGGALPKYAAIFDLNSGVLLDRTQNFPNPPPLLPAVRQMCAAGEELLTDFWIAGDDPGARRHLRGVWMPAPDPGRPRAVLLMGVPDEILEHVRKQRLRAAVLSSISGLLLAFAVARLIARRLTRGTEAIAETARAVAAGDMGRRVALNIPDREIAGLGQDLNDMIGRLAQLMQAHKRFTSDAAHELRSPITAVIGQLEVALRRPRTAEEYRDCLESCLEDMQRLSAMAEDLLALSRLEGRPERGQQRVELRAVATDTLQRLSAAAERAGVELRLLPGPDVTLAGDSLQLGRLLRNLVENAIRFSPPGQAIEVEIGSAQRSEAPFIGSAQRSGAPFIGSAQRSAAPFIGSAQRSAAPFIEQDAPERPIAPRVWMRVMDRGPGIPAALRERLFEPFMRGDEGRARSRGGTGLGLSIAQQITRVHGGNLAYSDRPGGGAVFTATLQ